jgi:hypothetical protein
VRAAQQHVIEVAIFDGDPLGSEEAGTVKCLARPRLAVTNGKTATFMAGGTGRMSGTKVEKPYGVKFELTSTALKSGKRLVECLITLNTRDGNGLSSQETRLGFAAKPNESVKYRLFAKSPAQQTWVVLTVNPSEAAK